MDGRRRALEFMVGVSIFIRVAATKDIMRLGKKGKLSPRYVRPYEITRRVGKAAYKLQLLDEMSTIHNFFHVSMLKKFIPNLDQVLVS